MWGFPDGGADPASAAAASIAGRALATGAACLLVVASWWSDVAGVALAGVFLAWELARQRRAVPRPGAA